jgi:hypothetical protein
VQVDEVSQHIRGVREEQQPYGDEDPDEGPDAAPRQGECEGGGDERHPGQKEIPIQERVPVVMCGMDLRHKRPDRKRRRREQREHDEGEASSHQLRVAPGSRGNPDPVCVG